MSTDDDIPRTRHAIETVATKVNIYFLCAMSLLGAVLFLVGLVQLEPKLWNQVPEPALFVIIGVVAFTLFFPWFLALYFARHFLCVVKRLEQENEDIRQWLGMDNDEAT